MSGKKMTRLHIALANTAYRWRQFVHWLYEVTHEPADDHDTTFARMVAENDKWAGHRFRAGQLRDARGRFANPDNQKESAA